MTGNQLMELMLAKCPGVHMINDVMIEEPGQAPEPFEDHFTVECDKGFVLFKRKKTESAD